MGAPVLHDILSKMLNGISLTEMTHLKLTAASLVRKSFQMSWFI